MLRPLFDKILQSGIRLVMLTGVTFTVTACYGLPPGPQEGDYPFTPDAPEQSAPQESTAAVNQLIDELLNEPAAE